MENIHPLPWSKTYSVSLDLQKAFSLLLLPSDLFGSVASCCLPLTSIDGSRQVERIMDCWAMVHREKPYLRDREFGRNFRPRGGK